MGVGNYRYLRFMAVVVHTQLHLPRIQIAHTSCSFQSDSVSMSELDLNTLFNEWLEEKTDELTKKGSKLAFTYGKALAKIKGHQEPIVTAKQLRGIQFVGEKIFALLCAKLKTHCADNSLDVPVGFTNHIVTGAGGERHAELDSDIQPKKRKVTKWVPKRRSGSWAILVSLYIKDPLGKGLSKEDIISGATIHCDSSFTSNPSARDFYSAWDGIKTLLKRELVDCVGRAPKVYFLTEKGRKMTELIVEQENIQPSPSNEVDISFDNGVRFNSDPASVDSQPLFVGVSASPSPKKIHDADKKIFDGISYDIWMPEDYDIILLVDNREVRSQSERDFFQKRITDNNVQCEVRTLSVGDILWIAKHKKTGKEVTLNYVCERKRLDDLAMSIRDGRFSEQKNRLRKSGLKNVYYLVEEGGLADVERIMEMKKSIETSISMVITVSNLYLQRFRRTDDTIDWLSGMTEILKKKYSKIRLLIIKAKTIHNQDEYLQILEQFREKFDNQEIAYECVHTFPVYQASLAKSNMITVKEMFILMLMLVKGVSLEKAIVLQDHFGTPKRLIEFFATEGAPLSEPDKGLLIMNLFQNEIGNKKINKAALIALYESWGKI